VKGAGGFAFLKRAGGDLSVCHPEPVEGKGDKRAYRKACPELAEGKGDTNAGGICLFKEGGG